MKKQKRRRKKTITVRKMKKYIYTLTHVPNKGNVVERWEKKIEVAKEGGNGGGGGGGEG